MAIPTPASTIATAGTREGREAEGTGLTPHMKVPNPTAVIRTARSSGQVGVFRSRAARSGTARTTPTSISGWTRAMDPSLRAVAWSRSAENEIVLASSQTGFLTTWARTPIAWSIVAGTVPATRCWSALDAANPIVESRQTATAGGTSLVVIWTPPSVDLLGGPHARNRWAVPPRANSQVRRSAHPGLAGRERPRRPRTAQDPRAWAVPFAIDQDGLSRRVVAGPG